MLPAAFALVVISSLVWGPLFVPLPFALFLLSFHAYWLWRAQVSGIHAVKGFFLLRRHTRTDWRQLYDQHRSSGGPCLDWDTVRHIVIIPNYTEPIEKLRACLDSLAASEVAPQIIAVLAMEDREGREARRKAAILEDEFRGRLGDVFSAFHPPDIVGEVAGKSSNEAWAARIAKLRVVDQQGHDLDHVTITSCDVDTVFHPKHFSCLTHKFATHPNRYRRFWQGPIFYYNNIWRIPAPLRLPHAMTGVSHLSRLARSRLRMVFPQSTYTLSLRLAHEVGYWDVDVVPEDWHMFLKCFFRAGGDVDVESMFIPINMDGTRSHGYVATFTNYYQQARRHAWGCTDIPYAVHNFFAHPEISLRRRWSRCWGLVESHLMWSTQWFLVTVGRAVPLFLAPYLGIEGFPHWFTVASRWTLQPCLATLIIILALDAILRPARPRDFRWWLFPVQYGQYFLMAVITFFSAALPALDAQVRLALGKRLEYRVTEKA